MYANLLCQRLSYVQSKVMFFPSLTPAGLYMHSTYMYIRIRHTAAKEPAKSNTSGDVRDFKSKNNLYDVWQFFNGRCIGAGFSEQNVAKNGDNLQDRFNQVNGKYWNTFKCTFMLKRTLYCLQKLRFNKWFQCHILKLNSSICSRNVYGHSHTRS